MIIVGVTIADKINMNEIDKELNSDPEPFSYSESFCLLCIMDKQIFML